MVDNEISVGLTHTDSELSHQYLTVSSHFKVVDFNSDSTTVLNEHDSDTSAMSVWYFCCMIGFIVSCKCGNWLVGLLLWSLSD